MVGFVCFLAGGWLWSGATPTDNLVAQGRSPLPAIPVDNRTFRDLPEPLEGRPSVEAPDFQAVIGRVSPAVVTVDAVKPAQSRVGKNSKPTEESGSGALVRFPGYSGTFVITNNHVITGASASQITVTLADGYIFVPDRIWSDPESDIALLRLTADSLPTIGIGNSDRVQVGQWALAFGSPFGLTQTVTHGIISARNRGEISLGNTIRIKEFLQTDAAINPGSSGGPLVDLNGDLIGVNTAIASTNGNNSGVSFSIPANMVKRTAMQLLENGTVTRGYLGLQLAASLEPQTALKLGLKRVWGAMVESVHPNGPAAQSGLKAGDVILKVDDVEIRNENTLINLVSGLPPGQRIRLTIWRDRQPTTVTATVGRWTSPVANNR